MVIAVTEKHQKNNCFIQVKRLFWSLKLETLLIFDNMLVLTSY